MEQNNGYELIGLMALLFLKDEQGEEADRQDKIVQDLCLSFNNKVWIISANILFRMFLRNHFQKDDPFKQILW